MILVNISAVCTSITFTLMPVSSSHFGPENFSGSRDCRPASQTMVIVLPRYFWASLTAVSAALSATALPAQEKARPAMAPIHVILLKRLIVSSQFRATARCDRRDIPMPGTNASHRGFHLRLNPSRAKATTVFLQPRPETRQIQHLAIDHTAGRASVLDIDHRPDIGGAVAGKALVRPAQGMGRQNRIVELENRIARLGRL